MQFKDDRKIMNVNKKDLFLHLFDELMAPESELFVYNESKTLAWFPPKVRTFIQRETLYLEIQYVMVFYGHTAGLILSFKLHDVDTIMSGFIHIPSTSMI